MLDELIAAVAELVVLIKAGKLPDCFAWGPFSLALPGYNQVATPLLISFLV